MEQDNSLDVLSTQDVAKIMHCCVRKVQLEARMRRIPMRSSE